MAQSTPSGLNRGASEGGRTPTEDVADKAGVLAGKASEQIGRVAQDVEDAARSFARQGREASEQVQVVAGNFKTALEKSVKDQPLATLVLAAGFGFIIGALWKS